MLIAARTLMFSNGIKGPIFSPETPLTYYYFTSLAMKHFTFFYLSFFLWSSSALVKLNFYCTTKQLQKILNITSKYANLLSIIIGRHFLAFRNKTINPKEKHVMVDLKITVY